MIKKEELGKMALGLPLKDYLAACSTLKKKIEMTVEVLKHTTINGCITGSCWLPNFDPDSWGGTPDIDVFVYSEKELIHAVDLALYQLKMKPGTGTDLSEKQEREKLGWLRSSGVNTKFGITTYKFYSEGVIINFTFKLQKDDRKRWIPITNAPSVLLSFDMTIVMQAYDIRSRVMIDMRPKDIPVTMAIPNPFRNQNYLAWNVAKWIRQFDRVVKYYARGYDTRPVAEFYLVMIDKCLEVGALFDSEASRIAFEAYTEEFRAKRNEIAAWLEAHKEDEL